MNEKELIGRNKKTLYECEDLIFSGIPVKFAGAGPKNVKLKWSLTGIAKEEAFAVEQTMWVPYTQLAQDFLDKVQEVCSENTTDVKAIDISFFKE